MNRRNALGLAAALADQMVISAGDERFRMPLESDRHTCTFMQWPALKSICGSQEEAELQLLGAVGAAKMIWAPGVTGAVIGAEFGGGKTGAEAQQILERLCPGREVVSLDADAIGEAGGGIHCSTQQQPPANV